MRILGVHDGIDASACLLEAGKIRFALQEERFTGVKQQIGYPVRAVQKILELAKLDISQVDELALSTIQVLRSPGVEGHTGGMKVQLSLKEVMPVFFGFYEDLAPVIKKKLPGVESFLWFKKRWQDERIAALREKLHYYGPLTVVDHHTAHAASAFYSAPWRDEPVLVLSSDAAGDGLCATVNVGENGLMTRIAETVHTESVGYIYSHITKFMGMKPHSHEYKVMGLAPWGAKGGEKSYDVLKRYIHLSENNSLAYKRGLPEPLHYIKPRLQRELYAHRFDNIAYGVQRVLEDLLASWARNAVIKTGIHKVAAAGGVFMNVKANKLIREMDRLVDAFFPMPSAGDETTSIGAAQWLYAQRMVEAGQEPKLEPLGPLYLGDNFTGGDVERSIRYGPWVEVNMTPPFDVEKPGDIDATIAGLILDGHIVARCRGPMEFGARALGNRSILCDARRLENVGKINAQIKSRDFWMPFAPVVTATEDFPDHYFATHEAAPYMTMAFGTTPMARRDIRAALHQADFTARPQILDPSWNPGYHRILERFRDETGIGGLLNTSFNLHGNPIVHGPREALYTFLNSGLEYLALGDFLVSKK